MPEHVAEFLTEVDSRLAAIAADARSGGLDAAIELLTTCITSGGVVQAFGSGHSQAFAMEIAGWMTLIGWLSLSVTSAPTVGLPVAVAVFVNPVVTFETLQVYVYVSPALNVAVPGCGAVGSAAIWADVRTQLEVS